MPTTFFLRFIGDHNVLPLYVASPSPRVEQAPQPASKGRCRITVNCCITVHCRITHLFTVSGVSHKSRKG